MSHDHGHDDFDFDAAPGLPTALPKGETLLWQGAPDWRALAIHAFHLRKLAVYFAVLVVWTVSAALLNGAEGGLLIALWPIPAAIAALSVMALLAYLTARATIYTITSQRVVIRFGVALPMTINLPYKQIDTASMKEHGGAVGDISLELMGDDRIAYLILWPHIRPWKFARAQPTLRCIPDVGRIARMLSTALATAVGPTAQTKLPVTTAVDPAADRDQRLGAAATA